MLKKGISKLLVIVLCLSMLAGTGAMAAGNDDAAKNFVQHLYKTVLDREPDQAGLAAWTANLVSGKETATEVAYGIVFSPEAVKKYQNDNAGFVDALYMGLFGRGIRHFSPAYSADELSYWTNFLDSQVTKKGVFKGFVDSIEFARLCEDFGVIKGTISVDEARDVNPLVTKFVNDLYVLVLGRGADIAGLNDWTNRINTGAEGAAQVAYGFFFSHEYLCSKNDADFVEDLYVMLLGRASDPIGKSEWLKNIQKDGQSRASVFYGIANSPEFKAVCDNYGVAVGTLPELNEKTPDGWVNVYTNNQYGFTFTMTDGWAAVQGDYNSVTGNPYVFYARYGAYDNAGQPQYKNTEVRVWSEGHPEAFMTPNLAAEMLLEAEKAGGATKVSAIEDQTLIGISGKAFSFTAEDGRIGYDVILKVAKGDIIVVSVLSDNLANCKAALNKFAVK